MHGTRSQGLSKFEADESPGRNQAMHLISVYAEMIPYYFCLAVATGVAVLSEPGSAAEDALSSSALAAQIIMLMCNWLCRPS